jgi:hypothetical protein
MHKCFLNQTLDLRKKKVFLNRALPVLLVNLIGKFLDHMKVPPVPNLDHLRELLAILSSNFRTPILDMT